jgi:hypothetical protein
MYLDEDRGKGGDLVRCTNPPNAITDLVNPTTSFLLIANVIQNHPGQLPHLALSLAPIRRWHMQVELVYDFRCHLTNSTFQVALEQHDLRAEK